MRTTPAGFKAGSGADGPADLLERLGPTLLVDVGLKSRAAPGDTPDLPLKRVRALIDTGASGECIDDELARALKLPVSEHGRRRRAARCDDGPQLRAIAGPAAVPAICRRETRGGRPMASLGRAFLRRYRMNYDGQTGAVEIVED